MSVEAIAGDLEFWGVPVDDGMDETERDVLVRLTAEYLTAALDHAEKHREIHVAEVQRVGDEFRLHGWTDPLGRSRLVVEWTVPADRCPSLDECVTPEARAESLNHTALAAHDHGGAMALLGIDEVFVAAHARMVSGTDIYDELARLVRLRADDIDHPYKPFRIGTDELDAEIEALSGTDYAAQEAAVAAGALAEPYEALIWTSEQTAWLEEMAEAFALDVETVAAQVVFVVDEHDPVRFAAWDGWYVWADPTGESEDTVAIALQWLAVLSNPERESVEAMLGSRLAMIAKKPAETYWQADYYDERAGFVFEGIIGPA